MAVAQVADRGHDSIGPPSGAKKRLQLRTPKQRKERMRVYAFMGLLKSAKHTNKRKRNCDYTAGLSGPGDRSPGKSKKYAFPGLREGVNKEKRN